MNIGYSSQPRLMSPNKDETLILISVAVPSTSNRILPYCLRRF
jgi:hypothetical protein